MAPSLLATATISLEPTLDDYMAALCYGFSETYEVNKNYQEQMAPLGKVRIPIEKNLELSS